MEYVIGAICLGQLVVIGIMANWLRGSQKPKVEAKPVEKKPPTFYAGGRP